MREIKFRAWDKFQEEMVSVDRINFDVEEIDVVIKKTESVEDFYSCGFDEIELMQYTGVKDKNGKEIYEGDIYKTEQGSICKVIWYQNGWKGHYRFKKTYQGESYIDEEYLELRQTDCKRWGVEVIGNVYENPELLEVKI